MKCTPAKKILDSAFKKFNPFLACYLYASQTAKVNAKNLGKLYIAKELAAQKNNLQDKDEEWDIISGAYGLASILPEPYREAELADFILINLYYLKDPSSKKAVELFFDQYPKSKYNIVFMKGLLDVVGNDTKTNSIQTDSFYSKDGIVIFNDTLGLQEILSKYFKDKPVLIDCWSTWCKYCIAEFPYYNEHKKLMQEFNIQNLFISFDAPAMKKSYTSFILSKKLEGYHILTSEKLTKDIHGLTGVSRGESLPLPRYILLDRDKRILSLDFTRPSNVGFQDRLKSYFGQK